ncbi:hypothetical protein OG21DRAFT_1175522 [Imleria badia]|nr:hypothetical protein OG21DRAFT_1175522 [Imleria badia]
MFAVHFECLQGVIIYAINGWALLLFLGAADFIMILRVWAMYNRSRLILSALLMLFSMEIIFTLLAVAIYSDSRNLSVVTSQLDLSICVVQPTSPIWMKSLQMYRMTNQWQLNRYMILLVKQGILYFFAVFLFALINALAASGKLPVAVWQVDLLTILE